MPCVQWGKAPSHVERDSTEDPFRVERDSVGVWVDCAVGGMWPMWIGIC